MTILQSVSMLVTGLTAIIILGMTNRHARKEKELEHKYDIDVKRAERELNREYSSKTTQDNHENQVLTSLVKILFDVQLLYVELSCDDSITNCINGANIKFRESLSTHQADIAQNQLYLPSKVIGRIYTFYASLSNMLIDLQQIETSNKKDFSLVCVHEYSQKLADEVIEIHEILIEKRDALSKTFNREDMLAIRNCCGKAPSRQQIQEYTVLKTEIQPVEPLPDLSLGMEIL